MEKKKPEHRNEPDRRKRPVLKAVGRDVNSASLRGLAGFLMRLPCNRNNSDKLGVYESQRVYTAYFREVYR